MPLFRTAARLSAALLCGVGLCALVPASRAAAVQDTPAASAPASPAAATLHPDAVRQIIYGFGGSQTYNGDALADFSGREAVYKALFSDLKLDILRLRNYYDYAGQETAFEKRTREFARAARRWSDPKKRGGKVPVRLMFTSWSPPATLKSNNRVSGRSDGTEKGQDSATLRRDPDGKYAYGAFADWWLASLRKFNDLSGGAYPDYIALQNELDFPASYEGCRFLPTEGTNAAGFPLAGYDQALETVSQRLTSALGPDAPKILGPETFSIKTYASDKNHVQSYVDPATLAGKAVLSHLFGVSFHLYGTGAANPVNHALFHASLAALKDTYHADSAQTPLFETEYLEGDSLTSLAGIISDTLTEGEASAYLVWILARSVQQPGYALVYYNPYDNSVERRERFYAVKHFSAFVGEGWHRIDADCADSAVKIAAFVAPDKQGMAAVLINPTDQERRIAVTVAGSPKEATTAVYRSTEGEGGERWREMGALPASGLVTLPKRSVATVTFGLPATP